MKWTLEKMFLEGGTEFLVHILLKNKTRQSTECYFKNSFTFTFRVLQLWLFWHAKLLFLSCYCILLLSFWISCSFWFLLLFNFFLFFYDEGKVLSLSILAEKLHPSFSPYHETPELSFCVLNSSLLSNLDGLVSVLMERWQALLSLKNT